LLELSRSSVYYQPQPTSRNDLRLMRRIDELHLEHPFAGARMLRDMLKLEGHEIGRKHVGTLMKKLDIQAIYRKANTSRRNQAHRIYPYLLRDLTIDRPNQVWAMDTTYIPMRRGFVYLSAVLDWATRRVLAWRLSNSLTADPCVDALEEAIMKYGSTGDHEHRPGQPIHQCGLHWLASGAQHSGQHGWQGLLAGQRLRRTPLEIGQVRGDLPARLRHRFRGPAGAGPLFRFLQSPSPALNA
jgi:transposase InsO family protein